MSERDADRAVRERLAPLLDALERGLVERRREVRLALLAALAGEHTLLIGPPGTAKSALARRLHLAFEDARYFERLLTRFSVPEELFGPLSISALEQDRYERQTTGYLPQASIAFIDEVFKANSAILNALLTLLNERKFDNGAGRADCPLISVIGATNEVPAGEVGDAFFDRFLVRLPVAPVSDARFDELLAVDAGVAPPIPHPVVAADRDAIARAAHDVVVGADVVAVLGELRRHLDAQSTYVSDRRWTKIVRLLKTAAATEGRTHLRVWDAWLVPWCTAHTGEGQAAIRDWLVARLGIRDAAAPPRLARIVQAFEAQADLERNAEELDYDASGRLHFDSTVEGRIADPKGGSHAARMTHMRRRRYGETHVGARVREVDDLAARIDGYVEEVRSRRAEIDAYAAQSLWIDRDFALRISANLEAVERALAGLGARTAAARGVFVALPRLPDDPGTRPEPIADEMLAP